MFAHRDSEADIAWFPTGEVRQCRQRARAGWAPRLRPRQSQARRIEVWDASTRLPARILEALPAPGAAHERSRLSQISRAPARVGRGLGQARLEPAPRDYIGLFHNARCPSLRR